MISDRVERDGDVLALVSNWQNLMLCAGMTGQIGLLIEELPTNEAAELAGEQGKGSARHIDKEENDWLVRSGSVRVKEVGRLLTDGSHLVWGGCSGLVDEMIAVYISLFG